MRKLVSIAFVLLLCITQVFAQDRTVTGKVTDEKDGTPLAGVSVTVKGTTIGTTTGADGLYRLSIPSSAKSLIFTFVNYETIEMAISGRSTINVGLGSNEKNLQEVVVTGYSREKKTQFTGSASILSGKVVETVPVGAFDQALQGRAPGMLVNSGSGQPGASANITIRGISSISGAGQQPLFIVDGVPLPSFDMQTVNPNDFESITVLKDASAAAQYGARGGLGVIVITTKRGKSGQANFTYRSQIGMTQAPNPNKFNMMNTTEIMQYEERLGLMGVASTGAGWAYSKLNPTYATATSTEQARRDFLRDSLGGINTNFYDILFRQGLSQTHEINMSGGTTATRYFMSASYFDQKGVDLKSRLKRYTTRFNLDNTIGKFSLQFNTLVGFSHTDQNEGSWYGNSPRNPFQIVWRAKPYENPYGGPNGSLLFGAQTATFLKQIGNAIEGANNSTWTDKQIKINSGITTAFKIMPYLTIKNTFGVDIGSEYAQRAINANSYVGSLQLPGNSGYDAETFRMRTQLINTTSAIFSKRFGKNDLEAGAYFEVVRGYQKGLGFVLYNLDPRLNQTGQGAGSLTTTSGTYTQPASSAKSGFGIRSYFATGRYTYDNKYTISGSLRRDGTSRILNEANKEITTWAVGLSWDAIKENFLSNQNVLTDLKVKASYGAVPNIGSIGTGTYGISGGGIYGVTNYLGPQMPTFSNTNAFAGSSLTGLVPATPGNPNLKIETIEKTNIGVDFALWKNRARFTVEAYRNITKDLFVSQPLPGNSGFGGGTLPINAGTMSNKGLEFTVSVDVLKTKNIDITIGGNHSINKNKIEDLGLVSEYVVGTFIIKEGLPYGTHYTQHYLGADPATGRPMFEKADGTTTTNVSEGALFHKFGTFLPKHIGGFTADVRIQRFTISALFSYQFDVTRYNNTENWTTRGTPGYHNAVNANRILLTDQWQKPGDVKYYQSPAYDRGFTSSDVHEAQFLRFRNLNVSYQIPEISVGSFRLIKSAKFYVQGQNLFIWSPWRGQDPEDDNNISLHEFPNPRAMVVGLDINF
ncbi:SusC/RagA family TonB-linked outer membrane protein [Lacibacter luteus]|uniref:SusC/RagA family TonB-linked outer membrane protein n=1 Tax=Lacibacter luteus TaxID=2508719 RepID=A0A4Q1CIA3_9BACT|nr:SusC/RagA family TonB-linked outer membrane protein [Lacibacter luteus]RXK59855.1 SusC/RagA family TonB-linked outer membrane protein [Lacibacter luteus]